MKTGVARRSFTVRVPGPLYEKSAALAEREGLSLNEFVRQAMEKVIRRAEEERLFEAFGDLGEDAAEADVEFALAAQSEVVLQSPRKRRKVRGSAAR